MVSELADYKWFGLNSTRRWRLRWDADLSGLVFTRRGKEPEFMPGARVNMGIVINLLTNEDDPLGMDKLIHELFTASQPHTTPIPRPFERVTDHGNVIALH
jgi:hypothetical protein